MGRYGLEVRLIEVEDEAVLLSQVIGRDLDFNHYVAEGLSAQLDKKVRLERLKHSLAVKVSMHRQQLVAQAR